MRILKLLLLYILIPITASAQFYVTGDDPGKLKWNSIDTESYRIIYPQGADSLAKVYGRKLEKYKIPVSRTSGYMTGEGDGKIMPVVMHAYNDANGSVAWAPKRMDLFTIPSAYSPEPMPWSTMLSIHESRHVTQMQFGLTEKHKVGKWILGDGWNMIAFLLYPNLTSMEGDAVVMETALSPSGRGRTADFLNYYWVAFDHGDFRDWFKWRFVSQLRYSPTYYALGYLTVGGYRYLYNQPYFVSNALHYAAGHSANLGCLESEVKRTTGKKWNQLWHEVCDTMYGKWKSEAEKRAPYIPSERVLSEPKRYTDYVGTVVVGEDIYAVKRGHVHAPSIVKIDTLGREKRVGSFASVASDLKWDDALGMLYWSEGVPDERWTLKSDSKIRCMQGGRRHTLRKKELLYNPAVSNGIMASVRYHNDGHSSLEVLETVSGDMLMSLDAPDSLQLVETAWIGDSVYVTAISENGYGIYRAGKSWEAVLGPQPVMIKDFRSYGDELMFTCDRTGVNELYHFDPSTGDLRQKTSTRYGAEDYQYSSDGKYLYYSSQTMMGKHLFRTPAGALFNHSVKFDSLYKYPIAEKIKEQEIATARAQGYADAVTVKDEDVKFSEPKRYRKVPHMFNFHTWFPAYVSVDNIMNNLSFDPLWQALSLGVSGVTQNRLATATGELGYSAHKDPYNPSKWRHSGHIKFTYSGLYPIFQFSFDINDRGARQYTTYADVKDRRVHMVDSRELSMPYIQGKASMYIPFNLTRGGWHKGIIPRVSYTISNDIFNTGLSLTDSGLTGIQNSFAGYVDGKKRIRQSLSASLRGYTMLPIANSQVYPRWGIGAEIGARTSIESYSVFSPMGYVYGYGYVPGIMRTHGIRLSAMWQTKLRRNSPFSQQMVDILPRGLSNNSALGSYLSIHNEDIVKVTADYAVPIYIGDITLGGNWLAIKRLVAYPHFDYTFAGRSGGLWSAGLDLTADLHAIITIETPVSLGVSFSWNGGSAWNQLSKGIEMSRWYVGPIFNVTF
ncbi:MAG: hypothetical protein IJV84_02550 [Bacteroidales bacterium]|nr:hypothetical protein [Bacteroidales bacterium]